MNKVSRRLVLRGTGAVAVALPLLESHGGRQARAAIEGTPPFGIFFRQANGVAARQDTQELGAEPERFWPHQYGPLTASNVESRAVGELVGYLDRLLIVHNVNMMEFDYGDGHARGALQGLTGRGPAAPGLAGASESGGVSLDHRIGAELNEDGRESLFMYAGQNNGWLGGACISYRGSADRRAPLHDPMSAYLQVMGIDGDSSMEFVLRQRSINDIVRDEMTTLLNSSRLSQADRERLEIHRAAIRDLENTLVCNYTLDRLSLLEADAAGYDSFDGDAVLAATRAHMSVAALAIACGHTRSVAIQVGNGNDGNTRYRNPETGDLMENYHYISHRRLSNGVDGEIIPDADRLHHLIDLQFARTFKHLLDDLAKYPTLEGASLLDAGFALWYSDLGNGPAHSPGNIPVVIAGSAGGFLKQGEYVRIDAAEFEPTHHRLLNTLGSAVGLRKTNGDLLDNFGDPSLPRGLLDQLMV